MELRHASKPMLTEITLRNFRCFERHVVPLHERTIIVGRNNAGKSTIVEALRLVSHVVNRYGNFQMRPIPEWLDVPQYYRGVAPSLRGMEFNTETLYHRYGDAPAGLTARFASGDRLEIYIGGPVEDPQLYAVVFDGEDFNVSGRGPLERARLPRVSILPQVAPLQRTERILDDEYVRGAIGSALTPLHFRNQIRLAPEHEGEFKRIAQETWPGLQVQGLTRTESGALLDPLLLMVRDDDFVAEVARMGHGLQMWLQTMWFLARSRNDRVIILDEPDVYMHADLQRRLVRFLRKRDQQVIIATHSIEIMAEAEPEDILIVDRTSRNSRFATSLPVVQSVADRIGGVHNFQLAKLWSSRRCLLLEGKDVGFLRAAHAVLFPDANEPLDALPRVGLGGWSGFPYAIGSRMLLQNSGGEAIMPYCILDRDYHTTEEITERASAARRAGVQLHVWKHKEIENYFLVPEAITRLLQERLAVNAPTDQPMPASSDVRNILNAICDELRDATADAMSEEIFRRDRGRGVAAANEAARSRIASAWQSEMGRWGIVSGKDIWAGLSSWSQTTYGVSLSAVAVARVIRANEVLPEMRSVVSAIELGRPFASVT